MKKGILGIICLVAICISLAMQPVHVAAASINNDFDASINDVATAFGYAGSGAAAETDTGAGSIRVVYNGELMDFDVQPIMVEGVFLVPIRFICERYGAEVQWDGEKQEVTVLNGKYTYVFKVGSCDYSVNGDNFNSIREVILINGRTLAPINIFDNIFRMTIDIINETNSIIIKTDEYIGNISYAEFICNPLKEVKLFNDRLRILLPDDIDIYESNKYIGSGLYKYGYDALYYFNIMKYYNFSMAMQDMHMYSSGDIIKDFDDFIEGLIDSEINPYIQENDYITEVTLKNGLEILTATRAGNCVNAMSLVKLSDNTLIYLELITGVDSYTDVSVQTDLLVSILNSVTPGDKTVDLDDRIENVWQDEIKIYKNYVVESYINNKDERYDAQYYKMIKIADIQSDEYSNSFDLCRLIGKHNDFYMNEKVYINAMYYYKIEDEMEDTNEYDYQDEYANIKYKRIIDENLNKIAEWCIYYNQFFGDYYGISIAVYDPTEANDLIIAEGGAKDIQGINEIIEMVMSLAK